MLAPLKIGITITWKNFVACTFMFFYVLASYYAFTVLVPNLFISPENRIIATITLTFDVVISLLVGSFFIEKINKIYLAYFASSIMIISTALFCVGSEVLSFIIAGLTAAVIGVSILSFFKSFKDVTSLINRGRIAGLTAFIVLPFVFLLDLFPKTVFYFFGLISILSLGLFICTVLNKNQQTINQQNNRVYFEKRTIALYLTPWILFSIVNATLAKIISIDVMKTGTPEFHIFLVGLQALGVSIGTLIAGVLADFSGRRTTLAISLTIYGLSAVIGGMLSGQIMLSGMYFLNGLSWGILFVIYILVIFGDLSHNENAGKLYALGLVPYLTAAGIGVIYQPALPLSLQTISLLTCFIIFLSVIPIFLSPELMSHELLEKYRLQEHLEKVKKIRPQG
ncbi:MAG: hypothetical protein NWE92_10865 [Candidatus Bathyarchaeota archaeon]|nr:hypothetical protein [Candidatus Bathyarchaeota archaeon]